MITPALADFGYALRFVPDWGRLLPAALVGAGAAFWMYRRLLSLYPVRRALLLGTLKTAALATLIAGLARPSLVHETEDPEAARVLLLVDDSASMNTRDGSLGRPRLDEARQAAFEKLLPALRGRLSVTTLAFGDGVRTIRDGEELKGSGSSSDIGGALLDAAAHYGSGGSLGALVLVTDGGESDAMPAALPAKRPVYALAVGTDLLACDDLRIGTVDAPSRVDAKADFEIRAEIAASGRREFLAGLGSVPVSLVEGGQVLQSQNVALTPENSRLSISFRVKSPSPGIHRYLLEVPEFRSEAAQLNNRHSLTVEASDPSLRVLYYAAELGQDYKPLRGALKADPGIQFTGLVRTGPDRFLLQGAQEGDGIGNSFPAAPATLARFKCIILENCQTRDLDPAAITALESFVAQGGGLIAVGGPRAFGLGAWAASPLAPAFPWQLSASENAYHVGPVELEFTAVGRAHPIFRDLTGLLASGSAPATLDGCNRPGLLRPTAQGLVEGKLANGYRGAVIAEGRHGQGKVLGIATNTLWKWSLAGAQGDKLYDTFWRQAIRYLAGNDLGGTHLRLSPEGSGRYAAGATATVQARVLDRRMQPLAGAVLSASLLDLNGRILGPVAFRAEAESGAYTAQVTLPGQGAFRLQVRASDSAGLLEARELLLEAGSGAGEGARLAVNEPYLKELARRTGGAVQPADLVSELADRILADVRAPVTRTEASLLWDSPAFFLIFLGLMAAEWLIRRSMNLI